MEHGAVNKKRTRGGSRTGFTLLELVLALAIVVIFGLVLLLNLPGRRNRGELEETAQQIAALLREAQSRSVSQASSSAWGVHFENSTITAPFYALFASSYASTSVVTFYRLPQRVQYINSTLAFGESKNITFQQLSGFAVASTTIGIVLVQDPRVSSTLRVASSGAVTY